MIIRKTIFHTILFFSTLLGLIAQTWSDTATDIVSVNGSITEIIYALGAEHRLLGVDTTSTYPPDTEQLPSVGYQRQLSAEGILSLAPKLVIGTHDAGPKEVLAQIRGAGVEVILVDSEPTIEGLESKVRSVASAINEEQRGEALIGKIRTDLDSARQSLPSYSKPPRILFLLHIGQGNDLSGGRKTTAHTMINLAGGINVMADAFSGYKPLTGEAAIAAAPDVLLLTERNLKMLGGESEVLKRPGLAHTPAGRAQRIVAMDGLYLLGFGPRTGRAVAELTRLIHDQH